MIGTNRASVLNTRLPFRTTLYYFNGAFGKTVAGVIQCLYVGDASISFHKKANLHSILTRGHALRSCILNVALELAFKVTSPLLRINLCLDLYLGKNLVGVF